MNLVEFRDWNPKIWSELAADDWEHRLQSVCGRFHPHLADDVFKVRGDVVLQDASGLELARVSNNLSSVHRGQKDIRLDFGGNFFLLMQLEGECGIEQNGTQSQIGPGDCILLDLSKPLLLSFDGKFSDHLSVHLPRQLLLSEKITELEISRRTRRRRSHVRRATSAGRQDFADARGERQGAAAASPALSSHSTGLRPGCGHSLSCRGFQ